MGLKTEREQLQEEVMDYIHSKEQHTRPSTLYTPEPPIHAVATTEPRSRISHERVRFASSREHIKLKSCPFCGGSVEITTYYHPIMDMLQYFVKCYSPECLVKPSTKEVDSAEEAEKIWNTRYEGDGD